MKKLFVITIASMMLAPAFAQFGDGDILLGGSFCIETDGSKIVNGSTQKSPKDFNFVFGPHVHYMLSDKMSIGGEFFVDLMSTTTFVYPNPTDPDEEVKEKDKQTGIGLGPVFRYWWAIGEKKKFGLFGEAGVGFATYGGEDEEYDFIADEVVATDLPRTNQVFLAAAPGMFYAPAECFFFEVRFGGFGLWYDYSVTKSDDSDIKQKSSYFKLGGDLDELFFTNTSVGFNFVF